MGAVTALNIERSFNKVMPWIVRCAHADGTSTIDLMSYPMRPLADPFIKMEVGGWLKSNCQHPFEMVEHSVWFASEADGLLFLLTYR